MSDRIGARTHGRLVVSSLVGVVFLGILPAANPALCRISFDPSDSVILPGRATIDGTEGDPDDVIFKVDGFPVLRREWTTALDYRRSLVVEPYLPMMMPQLVMDIVTRTSVIRHYQDRMPEIQAKLDTVLAKIDAAKKEAGRSRIRLEEAFGKIANLHSEDRTILGVGRGGIAGSNFPHGVMRYPFDRYAFSLEAGEISEPFPTVFGYHIVMPTRHVRGRDPMRDTCYALHILIAWDPLEPRPLKLSDRLSRSATVEVVSPEFRRIVPAGLQMGPGKLLVIKEQPEDPWTETIINKAKKRLAEQAKMREAALKKEQGKKDSRP